MVEDGESVRVGERIECLSRFGWVGRRLCFDDTDILY